MNEYIPHDLTWRSISKLQILHIYKTKRKENIPKITRGLWLHEREREESIECPFYTVPPNSGAINIRKRK